AEQRAFRLDVMGQCFFQCNIEGHNLLNAMRLWNLTGRDTAGRVPGYPFRGVGKGEPHTRLYAGSSLVTITRSDALTARWSLTGTVNSPRFLMGSSSWIFRRSKSNLWRSNSSAMSIEVTEP